MNSFNHYSYGAIVEWLYRYAAGLNPVESEPGFKRIRIQPMRHSQPPCRLRRAEAVRVAALLQPLAQPGVQSSQLLGAQYSAHKYNPCFSIYISTVSGSR